MYCSVLQCNAMKCMHVNVYSSMILCYVILCFPYDVECPKHSIFMVLYIIFPSGKDRTFTYTISTEK